MAFSRIKKLNCMSCVPGEMQKVHWRRCSNFSLPPLSPWGMDGYPPLREIADTSLEGLRSGNNDLPLLTHLLTEVKAWSQKNYHLLTVQITPQHQNMSWRPLGLTPTCIFPLFIFVLTRSLGLPGYPITLWSPDFCVYSQIQNHLTFSAGTLGLSPVSLNFSFRELQTSYVIAVSLPHLLPLGQELK